MSRPIGKVYNIPPQPPVEENTRWFPAGNLVIGVEYRDVDPDGLVATYGSDPAMLAELLERSPEGGFFDEGVSIHVKGAADDHEYLRFDIFDGEPHYHYNHAGPEPINHVVDFDVVAEGEMLDWALSRLETRLGAMLDEAGGTALVDGLDLVAVRETVAVAGALAREAQRRSRVLREGSKANDQPHA